MTSFTPIGTFVSQARERYEVARQPGLHKENNGIIRLEPKRNFEQALEDLEGFERIWVVFCFHRNEGWKPKVRTPRGTRKRGVFATRSPHRPNPIGLSCVELLGVEGLDIIVGSNDLLDGTPILDIKPYLPYSDSFPEAQSGWLEELENEKCYRVIWSEQASEQLKFVKRKGGPDLKAATSCVLQLTPEPHPNRRIRPLKEGLWELGYKTWRLQFRVDENDGIVCVEKVSSGYHPEEFSDNIDHWGDKELHRQFQECFHF